MNYRPFEPVNHSIKLINSFQIDVQGRYSKLILGIFMLLFCINLSAMRNWQIHTNTTHIYDMIELDGKIYQATWGGLEVFDTQQDMFTKSFSIFDGLQDQNVRSVSYLPSSGSFLLGTATKGINRLKENKFIMPINQVVGLPEGMVTHITASDSLIYAVVDDVIAVFVDSPDFPFPLPVNHYSTHNGLASDKVYDVELAGNYLFIATDEGLNIVDTRVMNSKKAWNLLTSDNSDLPDSDVTSLSAYEDVLAIGTKKGLVRTRFSPDPDPYLLPQFHDWQNFTVGQQAIDSNLIHKVFVDNEFNMWISYGEWSESNLRINLARNVAITKVTIDNLYHEWWHNEDGLTTNQIMGFEQIDDTIYIYTWGEGFFYFENDRWNQRKPNCLAANSIADISIDNNGVVWVCNGFIGPDYQMRANPGVSGFDGHEWRTFRAANSPLVHDKVFRIMTDANNRKWFGTWNHGISVWDEEKDRWYQYNRTNGLPANEIGAIVSDADDNIWLSTFSGGMIVLDLDEIEQENIQPKQTFHLYDPTYYSDVVSILLADDKALFGSFYSGLRIWDSPEIPVSHPDGQHWIKPPTRELTDGFVYVYDMDIRDTHFGQEIWIASENRYLMMYETNSNRWYRYGTGIKREVLVNNNWQIDRRYFVDEERLFGATPTFPTAILVDPFDRIWIGTESNGLTLYDLNTDRYSIYNTENTPLLSNSITSLAYEPFSGNLYIGTERGLNSVEIGKTMKREDPKLTSTVVYPNPFRPERDKVLRIANDKARDVMPAGNNECRIYNFNGNLVITLEENEHFEFSWDGRNDKGNKSSSGIYFYLISSPSGQTDRGTIVLVR